MIIDIRKRSAFSGLLLLILFCQGFAQESDDMPHGDNFEIDCETCHTTEGWLVDQRFIIFNHDQTGFALLGGHAKAECRSCHQSLVFNHIGHACADCHTDIHKNELGIRCENCHTPESWENREDVFRIHENSEFPLIGIHALLDCESCHQNQQTDQYKTTPVECQGCHLKTYMATLNPAHQKAGFPLNCESCHLPNAPGWQQALQYNHSEEFPLEGGHANLECIDCHSQVYSGTAANCVSCHQQDYNLVAEPNHLSFGFPTKCETCHNTMRWTGTSFDHLEVSGFALSGVHSNIQCTDCHINNQLTGLPRNCFGCHESDFNAVTEPNHLQNGFSHDCLDCHNENAWEPADFDHAQTAFPLTGAHVSVNCADCHQNGQWSGLAGECFACHEAEYNGVTDPNHVVNSFDKDCTTCHNTSAWEPADFDHARTAFPLTGAHVSVNCTDCHQNGQWSGLAGECFACHEAEYNGVTDPNHVTENFDKDCTVCHNTSNWGDADFNHALTDFPLEGAHVSIVCADCHSGTYKNTPMECVSCHEAAYTNTTDPGHAAAQFPTACENCHNSAAWEPADWDHDGQYFPIYSGKHQGEWDACIECHVNPADYLTFECITCHEHNNKADVDDKHKDEPDYSYDSPSCYRCHPDGEDQ